MLRFGVLIFLFSAKVFALPTFTVGVEDIDYSPIYSGADGPGHFKGYAREILDRFAKSENIEFKYIPLPVKRFLAEYQEGKMDFAFPDNPNWNVEAKKKLKRVYSSPIITFQDAIFVRPEKLGQGIENLRTLGTLKGFSYWKFQQYVDSGKMQIDSSLAPEGLINMGLLGRVEGINLAQQVVYYYLKKLNREGALIPDPQLLPIQDSHYYLSTLRHPEMIKKLNVFLKKDRIYINQLKKKYGL